MSGPDIDLHRHEVASEGGWRERRTERMRYTIGVDVGTSSSKGVLVDAAGTVVATSVAEHTVDRPRPGWVEMDGRIWWCEFVSVTRDLLAQLPGGAAEMARRRATGASRAAQTDGAEGADSGIATVGTAESPIAAVGVSGMGPCVLLADDADEPVRPAILYGVDMRAVRQIEQLVAELGDDAITRVGGSRLTSQAGGPKIVWVAQEEPNAYACARRLYMPASYLVRKLTDSYVLDHHSASQVSPLYDVESATWHEPWWRRYARGIEAPELRWAGDIAGRVTPAAAEVTGLPMGIPVITGTIDAWSESASVGADRPGDLFLMYGTTVFLIATTEATLRTPSMWTTVGVRAGSRNLAGGLATAGGLTRWMRDLMASDYATLVAEAEAVPAGSHGLVMLPYFAGERTPILDPDARGVIAGLTLSHTRADLYRAALEATAFGIRHNIETMRAAGANVHRIIAAGGGTQSLLWPQIVSDVTGLTQQIPRVTIGASYGAAFLASCATAEPGHAPTIDEWNPPAHVIRPNPVAADRYDERYALYRRLYRDTVDIVHELAGAQQAAARAKQVRASGTS